MNPVKKYILVAEDDRYFANTFLMKLGGEGYEVEIVGDGEAAIRSIKNRKPDLFLLDLIMPLKGGFEVLEELKEKKLLNGLKVVVLTNLSPEENKKKVLSFGVLDFIVKSDTSIANILSIIKNHLSK
jgi:DNA-binding response OmpR family regulator